MAVSSPKKRASSAVSGKLAFNGTDPDTNDRNGKHRRYGLLLRQFRNSRSHQLVALFLIGSVALSMLQLWNHHTRGWTRFVPLPVEPPRRTTPPSSSSSSSAERQKETETHKNKKDNKPLNILLLYADDWRYDSLGVAGNPFVKTPFLDKLARDKGIRFTHNCVTTSICWMSRATLHTGLYASQHKGWMPDTPHWYQHWYESFPFLMKTKQRYSMAHVGKWDWNFFHDVKQIFETYTYSRIYQGQHWYTKDEIKEDTQAQTKVTGQPIYNEDNYKVHNNQMEDTTTTDTANQQQVHITDRTVHDAMEFLQHRPQDQPFMMTVAFFPPHSVDGTEGQFYPQPETAKEYDLQHIGPPLPPTFDVASMNASWDRLPQSIFREPGNEARVRWHLRFDNATKYDTMMHNYFRMITGVDAACQTLVEEVERQGIMDDTLIIFTTDNGFYHGEHGLAGKWFPHEESIRVPLIIVDPRAPANTRGTVRDEMTLNIDLTPTLLSAAQTSIPDHMPGRDLSELYLDDEEDNEATRTWRQEWYYEHPQMWDRKDVFLPSSTALVRKTHKYIRWGARVKQRVEQLFDLTRDPQEEVDVSTKPEYAKLLSEMRQRHDELQRQVGGKSLLDYGGKDSQANGFLWKQQK